MGTASTTKVFLHIINSIFILLGIGLASTSLWFFVQVHDLTSLRNSNHYLLDYNVYWPQAIPWMFFIIAVFVMCVSCCGFTGARKNSRGLLMMYIIFIIIVILALVAAAVVALIFADNQSTETFVKDTVWDVYSQSTSDPDVAAAFGNIERKLHCCGAVNPRDYKKWKNEFPKSCCDDYYHGFLDAYPIDCQFTNQAANDRHGCSVVASTYAKIVIKVLSGVSLFTALIGILSIVIATTLSKALKMKPRVLVAQHESESKKVLL